MKSCFYCGGYDEDYGCTIPSIDRKYACPLECKEKNHIKELRRKYGMTQEELARFLRTSKRNIENWEQGKNNPAKWVESLIAYKLRNEKGEKE